MSEETNRPMFTCPNCNQRFSVAAPKPEEPLNTLRASVVVIPHEKPIRCQNAKCGKSYIFALTEAQLKWNIIPITDEQAASISDRVVIARPLSLIH